MGANLQDVFLKLMGVTALFFAVLCVIKKPLQAVPRFWGTALRALYGIAAWAACQFMLNLVFLVSYVLYVKDGVDLTFSDLGVAFTAVSVIAYFLIWRFEVLSRNPWSLFPSALYSGFLLYRFLASGGGLGFFGYIVYNPMFGFIGSNLQDEKRLLASVSALLPFACTALGKGLAAKRIDKI